MKCKEFRQSVDRRLDGELDKSTLEAFELHKSQCPECNGLFELQEQLVSSIRSSREVDLNLPPMEVYMAQLRERLAAPESVSVWQRTFGWLTLRHAYVGAGFALALVCVILFVHFDGRGPFNIAKPNAGTVVEYLEVPSGEGSAVTYINKNTDTTVVWLNGVEVNQIDSPGPEESKL